MPRPFASRLRPAAALLAVLAAVAPAVAQDDPPALAAPPPLNAPPTLPAPDRATPGFERPGLAAPVLPGPSAPADGPALPDFADDVSPNHTALPPRPAFDRDGYEPDRYEPVPAASRPLDPGRTQSRLIAPAPTEPLRFESVPREPLRFEPVPRETLRFAPDQNFRYLNPDENPAQFAPDRNPRNYAPDQFPADQFPADQFPADQFPADQFPRNFSPDQFAPDRSRPTEPRRFDPAPTAPAGPTTELWDSVWDTEYTSVTGHRVRGEVRLSGAGGSILGGEGRLHGVTYATTGGGLPAVVRGRFVMGDFSGTVGWTVRAGERPGDPPRFAGGWTLEGAPPGTWNRTGTWAGVLSPRPSSAPPRTGAVIVADPPAAAVQTAPVPDPGANDRAPRRPLLRRPFRRR